MITLPLVSTAFTAARDAAELVALSTYPLWLHEFFLGQSTEVGDAQDEELIVSSTFGHSTSGSGGNSAVTCDVPPEYAAFSSAETWNTTQTTGGTPRLIQQYTWKVLQPLHIIFTPQTAPIIRVSERWALGISAPADSVTGLGYVKFAPYPPR